MFGSQALETAIGLATLFFLLATAASAICEVISRWFGKRAKDLERSIGALLSGQDARAAKDEREAKEKAGGRVNKSKNVSDEMMHTGHDLALRAIQGTSVWKAAEASAGKSMFRRRKDKGPSYLSAKAFADAVIEYISSTPTGGAVNEWPSNLEARLKAIVAEGRQDVLSVKAGLESWFDEAMGRTEGAYKRWATAVIFAVGLVLAIAGNVSAIDAAKDFWTDPVARAAVVDAAEKYVEDAANKPNSEQVDSVDEATALVAKIGFPVGWNAKAKDVWVDNGDYRFGTWTEAGAQLMVVAGWILTALLVMLGGPFWFDLLTRMVSLRGTGSKPELAAKDDASATTAIGSATGEATAGASAGNVLDLEKRQIVPAAQQAPKARVSPRHVRLGFYTEH